jgi:ribosomal protein S18 acetylase RimI-like enzyme
VRTWSSRLYESEQDLQQMQDLLMGARARSDDWHFWHVGELAWNFFMIACHLDPREHIRLWHDRAGKLAGYAMLGEDPAFDWQVSPEFEWTGIETEAIAWAESRLAELRGLDAQGWGGNLVSISRQDNRRRISFLEQHGFRLGEYAEINFLRSLDEPVPESIIPTGCQVRGIMPEAGEISNRAGAQREVWRPWTVGNVSDEDYARFMRLPCYYPQLDVVAVAPDGGIAAYVNSWIDPVNRIGDFGPVGARPAFRRRGLTRGVLLEGLRRMQAHGMDCVIVSTGVENTPAIRLYESIGFKRVNKVLEYVKTG